MEKSHTLLEQIGGEEALEKIIDSFYVKMLADERVKHFFDKTDMNQLKAHQKRFLTFAFGGPNKYTGRTMKGIHQPMGIKDGHLHAMLENLTNTAREFGANEEQIADISARVMSLRDQVVSQ